MTQNVTPTTQLLILSFILVFSCNHHFQGGNSKHLLPHTAAAHVYCCGDAITTCYGIGFLVLLCFKVLITQVGSHPVRDCSLLGFRY